MSLTTLKEQNDKSYKHAIILVHGLNGSNKTWGHKRDPHDPERFIPVMMNDPFVKANFKVFLFDYTTRTINFLDFLRQIKSVIPSAKEHEKFNVGLRKISEVFETAVRTIEPDFETISFIGHSMGGLVIKKALVFLSNIENKLPFFLSLNVPHQGSSLATAGQKVLFGSNIQLENLKLLGEYTTALSNDYTRAGSPSKIIYVHGTQDKVVAEAAAIPPSASEENWLRTDDNHYDICRIPQDQVSYVYTRLKRELRHVIDGQILLSINIPVKSFFNEAAMIIAKTEGLGLQIEGFNQEQLNCTITSGLIHSKTAIEALEKLRFLSVPQLPNYSIEQTKNNFIIKII
ncbi:esterase/lipase family protein [Olleya sp. R77988]|uniref:esterase/lipase family protein n=1 Tax=Olleya sp. R77988 TaxID=3093875 RepID=UPI0037CA8254